MTHALTTTRGTSRYSLIIGGAGFIGSNLAARLLKSSRPVVILDSLARPGVERNIDWLVRRYGETVRIEVADVRDGRAVSALVNGASEVFHLAAQVAVTTSLSNPVHDFGVNAAGTLTVLEAIRQANEPPPLIFTSTNKVYGALAQVAMRKVGTRYVPSDPSLGAHGISERYPLDFHSPYGCSKGAADQYVLDYARSYGIQAVVFRMSCIYGPRQFGTEDQGWLAHFFFKAARREPITIYGDGCQVRDILFVDDLLDAFVLARQQIDQLSGHAFNIGGGVRNAVSLLEVVERLEHVLGRPLGRVAFDAWRTGDQLYYVSDTRRFRRATGWYPRFNVDEGLSRLGKWALDVDGEPRGMTRGAGEAADRA